MIVIWAHIFWKMKFPSSDISIHNQIKEQWKSLCGSLCGGGGLHGGWKPVQPAFWGCSLELLGGRLSDLTFPERALITFVELKTVWLSLRHLLWEGSTGPSTGDFQMEYSCGGAVGGLVASAFLLNGPDL